MVLREIHPQSSSRKLVSTSVATFLLSFRKLPQDTAMQEDKRRRGAHDQYSLRIFMVLALTAVLDSQLNNMQYAVS